MLLCYSSWGSTILFFKFGFWSTENSCGNTGLYLGEYLPECKVLRSDLSIVKIEENDSIKEDDNRVF